jgi:hypothetical protein
MDNWYHVGEAELWTSWILLPVGDLKIAAELILKLANWVNQTIFIVSYTLLYKEHVVTHAIARSNRFEKEAGKSIWWGTSLVYLRYEYDSLVFWIFDWQSLRVNIRSSMLNPLTYLPPLFPSWTPTSITRYQPSATPYETLKPPPPACFPSWEGGCKAC